jgi:hypothetical protein
MQLKIVWSKNFQLNGSELLISFVDGSTMTVTIAECNSPPLHEGPESGRSQRDEAKILVECEDGLWSDRYATQCSYEHFVVKTLIELFSVMMTIRMCGPEYPESRSDRYARPCRGHRLDGTGPNMAKVGVAK